MAQQDYTAIRVTPDVKAKAEDAKRDGETWNEYVLRCAENPPEVREYVDAESIPDGLENIANGDVDTDKIAAEVSEQIDYAELSNRVANELEGRMR